MEGQFGNKKYHSQIYQLKREIAQISQENRKFSDLIDLVNAKYEELKIYCSHTTFLVALDPSYETVRAQILLLMEKLSFDVVTSRVRQETTRRVAMAATDSNPKPEAHAFSSQRPYDKRIREKMKIVKCTHYKRDRHTNDKCWVLYPHLKPKKNS
jgi:hypothetical protein